MRTFEINEGKFKGIIDILEEKEDGNVEVDVPYFKTSIRFSIDGKMSDIYIKKTAYRYIISRVYLENQRQGTMESILKEVVGIAKSEGFNEILIESVSSEAMYNFCIKHGLKKKLGYLNIDFGIYGDFIMSI